MTHPANNLRNLKRRVDRARTFPTNTCAASRHVCVLAFDLLRNGSITSQTHDTTHCAESMLSVVESLWKARTRLAKMRGE